MADPDLAQWLVSDLAQTGFEWFVRQLVEAPRIVVIGICLAILIALVLVLCGALLSPGFAAICLFVASGSLVTLATLTLFAWALARGS